MLAVTAAGSLHGYYNGLDVAPFNWVLPANELESFRKIALEDPAAAKSVGGQIGLFMSFVPSVVTLGSVLWYNSISNAVQAYQGYKSKIKRRSPTAPARDKELF